MKTLTRTALFGVLALVGQQLAGSTALAQPPRNRGDLNSRYSCLLKAEFRMEYNLVLPWYPQQFPGARITAMDPDSPLHALGLQLGDVITRLDGCRCDSPEEMNRHINWTQVRYIRSGSNQVSNGQIFIPVQGGGGGGGGGGGVQP